MCVALWELSVGMQPLSTAPHAFPSWLEVGSVCERWRRDGREGGGLREVDRATYPQAEELVRGGSPRAREAERKNRGGGWRLDVDTKCGVISHVVCVTGFTK